MSDRATQLLNWIYEDVEHRLNPGDEECPECGGEGYTFDCFDGCCMDAESGCEDCARRCAECVHWEMRIRNVVRLEVIRMLDVDVAIAFAKHTKRWSENITRTAVLANLHAARVGSTDFSIADREASAAWVEGLL
jgi:predicted Fe-S protein YdhL (DUF1289 family)